MCPLQRTGRKRQMRVELLRWKKRFFLLIYSILDWSCEVWSVIFLRTGRTSVSFCFLLSLYSIWTTLPVETSIAGTLESEFNHDWIKLETDGGSRELSELRRPGPHQSGRLFP